MKKMQRHRQKQVLFAALLEEVIAGGTTPEYRSARVREILSDDLPIKPIKRRNKEFVRAVQQQADDWERRGWLHKYHDALGVEYWELTPLGRRKLSRTQVTVQ